jgi:hypothetical protein
LAELYVAGREVVAFINAGVSVYEYVLKGYNAATYDTQLAADVTSTFKLVDVPAAVC